MIEYAVLWLLLVPLCWFFTIRKPKCGRHIRVLNFLIVGSFGYLVLMAQLFVSMEGGRLIPGIPAGFDRLAMSIVFTIFLWLPVGVFMVGRRSWMSAIAYTAAGGCIALALVAGINLMGDPKATVLDLPFVGAILRLWLVFSFLVIEVTVAAVVALTAVIIGFLADSWKSHAVEQ